MHDDYIVQSLISHRRTASPPSLSVSSSLSSSLFLARFTATISTHAASPKNDINKLLLRNSNNERGGDFIGSAKPFRAEIKEERESERRLNQSTEYA